MSESVLLISRINSVLWIVILILAGEILLLFYQLSMDCYKGTGQPTSKTKGLWHAPDTSDIPPGSSGELIRYGRELIEHTATYLGPQGTLTHVSNGMNCQNCHLHAGTKPFAANYSAVASTYPRFRARSGTVEGFAKRVNDCFERSLNGKRLPVDSREMKAIIAYLRWVGKDVQKGETPQGAGLIELPLLDRPADPVKGGQHYAAYCSSCHGAHGEGVKEVKDREWRYPPLWGADSYNTGAGLYRISRLAAFIKANMPYGATFENPVLPNDVAWDIAAYVNTMPRPRKDFPGDWPDVSKKPMDHPFGPYADDFSEKIHKYGPFGKIEAARKR
jgi:thiosulfate dehydrogenase